MKFQINPSSSFTPEYIAGDLDSVYKDVLLHYEKMVSKIIEDFEISLSSMAYLFEGTHTKGYRDHGTEL